MGKHGKTRVEYTVEIVMDNDVWQMNYGLNDPTPKTISDDIREYMRQVVEELVKQHIDGSGNAGTVAVGGGRIVTLV